jgi:hypothetical protein
VMLFLRNQRAKRLLSSVMIGLGVLLWLLLSSSTRSQIPSIFASPMSTPTPSRWGIHFGNHVYGEAWTKDLLKRIDPTMGGTWPDTVVVLSRNVYDVPRNTSGDCRITGATGKYPLLTATNVFTGYLQRASAAGVKIIIRIWPSPSNFISTTYHINLSNQPANGNRCDDGSIPNQIGNRSYDDVGDEIIQIHQWNAAHGITEAGFLPANEPNIEWYRGYPNPTLIPINDPRAWQDMDAYFTAVYTYVHSILPSPAVSVLTPAMAQEAYADSMDFNGCTTDHQLVGGGYGYDKMPNVFLYGYSNDGYAWNNYWNIGYEAWTTECRDNVTPHGQHVSIWLPLSMRDQMFVKPTYIIEADVKSFGPPQHGSLADKDALFGLTAVTSLNQFLNAEQPANHIAVWALNITKPQKDDPETNWHEAYRCNDIDQSGLTLLERPWFTLWWTGWPGWPAYCYKSYEPVIVKPQPTLVPTIDPGG